VQEPPAVLHKVAEHTAAADRTAVAARKVAADHRRCSVEEVHRVPVAEAVVAVRTFCFLL
jgi:hypothetical protein